MKDMFIFFPDLFYTGKVYNKLTCFEFDFWAANTSNKSDEMSSSPGLNAILTPTVSEMYINFTERKINTRVGTLIVATVYLQLIQNKYMFRSFTVLQCSHQHCVQPVASDVEVVGYL